MPEGRDLDRQRIEVERSVDAAARDARQQIQAYQQRLRVGLLERAADPRSARVGGWRAIAAPVRAAWRSVVRAIL